MGFAARYVELFHVLTLEFAMISISSESPYTIAGQCLLLLYCAFVYFVDKYTFLRVYRQTYYTSPKLDAVARYLVVIPLVALFAFPLQRLQGACDIDRFCLTLPY